MEKRLIWDFGAQFAREPVLRRMPDGSLACLFLTGGPYEPHNQNVAMMSRSEDDGDTWSRPRTLFAHSRRGVWATELFTGGNTPMVVLHTYDAQSHYRELQTFRAFTYDSGRTWTEPASFPCGLNGVSVRQGIVLADGRIVFPYYWQETTYDFDWIVDSSAQRDAARFPFRCGVAISEDGGKTYRRSGCLRGARGLWEPNCVETEPGHLVMLMRDKAADTLARSESFDGGRTWTEPADSGIPNPGTKATLIKTGSAVLLINNFCARRPWRERSSLKVCVSRDGMRTWSEGFPIEPPEACYFYPHAFADDARRTLYVAYENAVEHRLARIPYAEIPGIEEEAL